MEYFKLRVEISARKMYRNTPIWGWGAGLKVCFQPLKVISPTASWIRWFMQVYAGVGVVSDLNCLMYCTICARLILSAKPPIQFRNRCAERNHSGRYTDSEQSVDRLNHWCQAPS